MTPLSYSLTLENLCAKLKYTMNEKAKYKNSTSEWSLKDMTKNEYKIIMDK